MLISGGKVLAIDKVNNDNKTLKGDGVFNPLEVNTNVIAEVSALSSVSATLSGKINSVSSKVDTISSKVDTISSALSGKQDKLNFKYNVNGEISAINNSAIAGGNKVELSSSNESILITSTAQPDGSVKYDLVANIDPVINPTIVSGENGLSARKVENGNYTTYYLGLSSNYISAISSVSGKLDKSFSSTVYPKTETSSNSQLTTEFAKYQPKGNYYSASNPSSFINKSSADDLYQPLGNYLTANALNDLSGNWQNTFTAVTSTSSNWDSVYNSVNTNSAKWNEVSAKIDGSALKNFDKIIVDVGTEDPIVIKATGSADNLSFIQGENLTFQKEGQGIKLSAKDTTYSSGNHIVISGNNNSINAVGLQPSGDYVSATDFDEFKDQVENEFEQTSAWVEENFLSANALDNLSGKWESASNIVSSHSANWDSVYESVNEASGDWNKVSDKLNKADFEEWSATIDTAFYSAGEGLALDNHTFSISAKYLSANALNDLSGRWENAAAYTENNSANFENLSATVKSNSANWTEVSSKANSADLTALSSKVNDLSAELTTVSGTLKDKIDVVSAEFEKVVYTSATANWDVTTYSAGQNIDITNHTISGKDWTNTIEEASANAVTTVENKFNGENNTITAYGTSSFANDKYTAGEGLALNDHQFYVSGKYITSANETLAGKMLILKDNEWIEMPEFGGFTTANSGEGHPDVQNPSTKLIYLVKNSSVTGNDKYSEWIYTSADAQTTAWECIGETTLDLTPYLTKDEAANTYQPSGYYVTSSTNEISANKNYALTNDGTNVKWVELEDNDTTYTAGKNIVISGNDNEISVSGLYNTTLTSEDDSVRITSTTDASGNIKYNLGVNTVPDISGVSGISAYYDSETDKYIVGLDEYNDIGFAKFRSNANTFTTSAAVTGYVQELNVNPTKITLNNDQILLKTGFYHIDVQLDFNITTVENYYYDVLIKSIPGAASITQMIDASYEHKETVDLSFDIRIANDDTPIGINVENFKENETFAITNLNIHEIVSMPSQIQGGAGEYQAGEAIDLSNNTVSVKYNTASGIAVDSTTNQLYIKLGEGLKFDTEGAAEGSLSLSNIAQDVIDTVETISNDLDEKVTSNFPPAMISKTDCDIAAYRNAGSLYGNLFNVSINSVIEVDRTQLGFYIYQVDHDKNVIFGLYEYQPDYPRYNNGDPVQGISGYGRTVPLCDTGVITIPAGTTGFCEYPIKNLNNTIGGDNPETRPALKSSCMYYATVFLGSDMSEGGLCLAGVPNGYAPQFNQIKPGLNVYQDNFNLTLNDAAYSAKISFNDFGFGWKYTNYPNHYNSGDTTSAGLSYQEKAEGHRFYMQIRNKPKTRN